MVDILNFSTVCSMETYKAFLTAFIDAHNKVVNFIGMTLKRSKGASLLSKKQKSSVHYIWPIPTMKKDKDREDACDAKSNSKGELQIPMSHHLHNDRPD